MTNLGLIDTILNLEFFAFIGVLIWLYTAAPTKLDDEDDKASRLKA